MCGEAQERAATLGGALVNSSILQNLNEGGADLLLQNTHHVVLGEGVFVAELLEPLLVNGNGGVLCKGLLAQSNLGKLCHLGLEAGGENCQTHNLDKSDILLLYVVKLGVGVVNSQGMLLGGDVVAKHQIKLEKLAAAAGNGRDGVVGLAVGLGKNEGGNVGVRSPRGKDLLAELGKTGLVGTGETDDGKGPAYNARLNVLKIIEYQLFLDLGASHCKVVITALHMVVGENGAANDGQIGIGAHEIVGEEINEIKSLLHESAVDLHGHVIAGKSDAVLVIVRVGRILEIPASARKLHGDLAQVLTGGLGCAARISHVLVAKIAKRIAGLLLLLERGNGLGVLFGLGEIDGDINVAVNRGGDPLQILYDAVAANVVAVNAKTVEIIGGSFGGLLVIGKELFVDNGGQGSHYAHKLGVKKIAEGNGILNDTLIGGVIKQILQYDLKLKLLCGLCGLGVGMKTEAVKNAVDNENAIVGVNHPALYAVVGKTAYVIINIVCHIRAPYGKSMLNNIIS